MRLRALAAPALLVVAACSRRASSPPPPPAERIGSTAPPAPSAPATAMPPAAPGEPVARPSRRGECDLGKALDAFLAGQEPVRCGDLRLHPASPDYERARACVLEAVHARKPFSLVWGGPAIDSILREAIAARKVGDRYEVRWFSYDSCPSGCGGDDPVWSSVRCEPLVDLRAACAALAHGKKKTDDADLRWVCDEDGVQKTRNEFELRCDGRREQESCGPGQP